MNKYVSVIEYENENLAIKDSEARTMITNMNNKNNRNLIILGDSYTTGDTHTGGHYAPWTDNFKNDVASFFNNIQVFASNGIGFSTGLGFNYYTLLNDNISSVDTTYPTTIFIVGGYNDVGKSNLANDIPYVLNSIKSKFNDINIVVAFVGNSIKYRTNEFFNTISIYKYSVNNVDKCIGVNGAENILCYRRLFTNDGFHPNEQGQFFLRCYLKNALINYSVNMSTDSLAFNSNTDFLTSSVGGTAYCKGVYWTENNMRSVQLEIDCDGTNIQENNNNFVKFGDFNCDFISNPFITFPVTAVLLDSDGNFHKEICQGKIENSALYIAYSSLNATGWLNKKITRVNFIFNYVTSAFAF